MSCSIIKLEVIKKIVDITILIVSVFFGVYAIAWGGVLFNAICVYINLSPNKKLLNYGVCEQLKDTLPTFLIASVMGFFVYWIQFLDISLYFILLYQGICGLIIYLTLCYLFKEEGLFTLISLYKNRRL